MWRAATPVPGIAKLNTGESAIGTVISCAAPGYCALDVNYMATSGGYVLPFIDSEVKGTWGAASPVPGHPVTGGNYGIAAISCPKPGDCVAAGNDDAGSYTINQQGDGWSEAAAISGLGSVAALSCPAASAAELDGTWGEAVLVPGAKAFTYKGKHATSSEIDDLSCPVLWYCVAVGDFFVSVNDSTAYSRGLVVSETAGAWGTAQVPPGLAKLDSAAFSEEMYVACATAATCVAIGTYDPSGYDEDGFLSAELPLQPTRTALHLSLAHVTAGKEQAVKITLSVTGHGSTPGAVPVGNVSVRAGSGTLCVIKLAARTGRATGSCTLTPRKLKPGAYLRFRRQRPHRSLNVGIFTVRDGKIVSNIGCAAACDRDAWRRAAPQAGQNHGRRACAARRSLVGRVRRAAAGRAAIGRRGIRVPGGSGRRSGGR